MAALPIEVRRLMDKRVPLRTGITSLANKASALTEESTEVEVKTLLSQLEAKAEKLALLDKEVVTAFNQLPGLSEAAERSVSEDYEKIESYNDKVIGTRCTLEALIRTHSPSTSSNGGSTTATTSTTCNGHAKSAFKLPEYKLSEFDGRDFLKFPSWFDQFKTLIHAHTELSDVQRFGILKESVAGQAKMLISGLLTTGENYAQALELLEQTYGDPNLLLGLFVSRLHAQQNVTDTKPASLQNLVLKFEQSYQEIMNLVRKLGNACGTRQDDTGYVIVSYFLTPHLLSKLPEEVQLRWYDRNEEPQQRYDFKRLVEYLKQDVKGRQACRLLSNNRTGTSSQREGKSTRHAATSALFSAKGEQSTKCFHCGKQDHSTLWNCQKFLAQNTEERHTTASSTRVCFNCLTRGHSVGECKSNRRCKGCSGKHHTLLCKKTGLNPNARSFTPHDRPATGSKEEQTQQPGPSSSSTTGTSCLSSSTRKDGPPTPSCSILQVVRLKVNHPSTKQEKEVYALFDSGATNSWIKRELAERLGLPVLGATKFVLQTFGGKANEVLSEKVSCNLTPVDGNKVVSFQPFTADTLAGNLEQLKTVPAHLNHLDLQATISVTDDTVKPDILIGSDRYWEFITGSIVKGHPTGVETIFGWTVHGTTSPVCSSNSQFSSSLLAIGGEQLWNLEALGITDQPNQSLEFSDPVLVEGKYEVRLPFKDHRRPEPNREQAQTRLNKLLGKISPEDQRKYADYFQKAYQEGIIERVPFNQEGFFLPYRGINQNSKLRIVFDASATDTRGVSLNQTLDPGANLLNELLQVLLGFRAYEHPYVADIKGAFHCLRVNPEDRSWIQFLWDGTTWRFTRLPFGLSCSPYLLNSTLQVHFRTLKDEQLSKKLEKSVYVDDLLASFGTKLERQEFGEQAKATLSTIGMELQEGTKEGKVLGVTWKENGDELSISLSSIRAPVCFTKRSLLSMFSSIFDPLGFLTPFIMRLKVLFQKTWSLKTSWDEQLPPAMQQTWAKWISETEAAEMIQWPRWVGLKERQPWQLHVFTDASGKAFAACAYAVTEEGSQLITAKARLVPISKKLTVPRAELMGVLIGVRLTERIQQAFPQPERTILWTDASVVLQWLIAGGPRSEIFVRNRLEEIRNTAKKLDMEFRFVPTEVNPADIPTRGSCLKTLEEDIWKHGPDFLMQEETSWPELPQNVQSSTASLVHSTEAEPSQALFKLEDCSTTDQLVSRTGWLKRFVAFKVGLPVKKGPLTEDEKKEALLFWIKHEQKRCYPEEYELLKDGKKIFAQSALTSLRPTWKNDTGLVIQPRTGEEPLILIPKGSHLAYLLVMRAHTKWHQGAKATLAELRRSFWLPHGQSQVKKHLSSCRPCGRFQNRPFKTDESALQPFRVRPAPPFATSGIDHFGPIYLQDGKKAWILLITCAVTRAIHVELCRNLSAVETYLRLRKFLATRVPPGSKIDIYSDNAKTFLAASVMRFPEHTINWKFIPERTPTWGSWWERMVGLIKRTMKIALRHRAFAFTELDVILQEIAACINGRPLIAASDDARDSDPITPNHFLFGIPPPTFLDSATVECSDLRKRLQMKEEFAKEFWKRFTTDYLSTLAEWRRVEGQGKTPEVGEVVLVRQNTPRTGWPLARIEELIKGRDGKTRAAFVRLHGTRTRRGLGDLIPLEGQAMKHKQKREEARTRSGRAIVRPARFLT